MYSTKLVFLPEIEPEDRVFLVTFLFLRTRTEYFQLSAHKSHYYWIFWSGKVKKIVDFLACISFLV